MSAQHPGTRHLAFPSPLGPLTVFAEDDHLIVIEAGRAPDGAGNDALLNEARRQLDAYFNGRLTTFDLPLAPHGTPRQREIWSAMAEIPYGSLETYGALAARVQSSARAVGGACGSNPLPILIPCHRVIAAGGRAGGYSFADGLDTKHQLLNLEGSRTRLL
ncbi:MAG: methylated-DNA--[protein]-cysteine S-methyltransferase [Rhodospirillales bacterium]